MTAIVKPLSEEQYPYPIHDWKNAESYSSPHDYFERPEKYPHKFLNENKRYQLSLKNYLSREYIGDSYSPYFFFEEYPIHKQPLWQILQGNSCYICHDLYMYWGWEFLRRNHAYQCSFDRYMEKKHSFRDESIKLVRKNTRGFIDDVCTILDEPHVLHEDKTTIPLIESIAGFFGIKVVGWALPDPRNNHPNSGHFWKVNPGVAVSTFDSEEERQRALHPRFEDEIVFRVDTRLPLPAQFNKIKTDMQNHAKRLGHKSSHKPNNEEAKRFIRVLDAARSGVKQPEVIAGEIYPHSDNTLEGGYSGNGSVKKASDRGLEMTREGYLRFFYPDGSFHSHKL